MKCPSCGAQMEEGTLYCEQCGEEIHIVPDFEPELDHDIQQTIKNITNDIWEQDDVEDREEILPEEDAEPEKHRKKKHRRLGRLFKVIAILFLLFAAGVTGVFVRLYYSAEYQTTKAREYAEKELYERAIHYYDRAIELDEHNVDLKVELAEIYFRKNNKMEYEYLLREIVMDEGATSEQVESAYGKLIAIYRGRGDYQEINDFLQASNNESVISVYQNYIAREPEFSVQEGYYNSIQPLKLSAFGTGKIYYTMDGSDPSEESSLYTAPILLEDGDYQIKAYYVSENGIYSKIVEKEYHIEIEELPPPEISVTSGEYQFPINIEVLEDVGDVYYTTDGSTPTKDSTLYTRPIHMPLGSSVFKFIRIGNGKTSEVRERSYKLTLNTQFTPEQAVRTVIDYNIRIGKIYDESGYAEDGEEGENSGARYEYQYQYVTNINRVNDFYVLMEVLYGVDGTSTRTGTYFAVNVYSGELFRLQINEYGYTLTETEIISPE